MSINLVKIFYCTTLLLFICEKGLILGLETQDDASEMIGLSPSKKEMDITKIEMGKNETIKKTQKVKKRPGVSAIDYATKASIEPFKEDQSSENETESRMISLNIPRLSNNSSLLISNNVEEKKVPISLDDAKSNDLISSGNLSSNSSVSPIRKVDSKMSSSAEPSANSSNKGDTLELKEDLNISEVRNGNKFISQKDASKITSQISNKYNNGSNGPLPKNEIMFFGDLGFNKTNLSNSDAVENSTALSNLTSSLSPKTLKTMSKPSNAKMGEIGKMGSSNVVLISSIIGIVCLCALIGIIAYKHVYAYWYRRHYSRVDFLIDGLYEM